MAKQKLGDKLTRIVEGAMGAADRAIAHAEKLQSASGTAREDVATAAAAAIEQTAHLDVEVRKACADAVAANDTWYEFNVRPLQKALAEAKDREAQATGDVLSVEKAIRELDEQREAACAAISKAETEALTRLERTAKSVDAKVEAAKIIEAHLDAAAVECRKAGGSVKDALGNLQRAAAQQKRPPVCTVVPSTEGMSPKLVEALDAARAHEMTAEEQDAQRRSFAFGNATLADPLVTREMVDASTDAARDRIGSPRCTDLVTVDAVPLADLEDREACDPVE